MTSAGYSPAATAPAPGRRRRGPGGPRGGGRVLLIYPPSLAMNREDRCQIPVRNVLVEPRYPPMDLLSLAAVAEAEGHACRVADYSRGRDGARAMLRDVAAFAPDVVLMSVTTPTLAADLRHCEGIRRAAPGVTIVAKGAHFLRFGREALESCPDLDLALRGEAEETFRDLLRGRAPEEVPGLVRRGPDGVLVNPDRPFIEDLDALPLPARHLVDRRRFRMPDSGRPMGVVRVSRGCPHHCFFCLATPVSGARVRARSPASIVEEVRRCVRDDAIRDFVFYSDVFNHDRGWVHGLCAAILASGLKFSWASNVRLSAVDAETARLMRRAGCSLVSFGVESGSAEILRRIGKGLEPAQAREAAGVLKRSGLRTVPYFMIGLPWETHETVEETIRLATEIDGDYAGIFLATPFPGTRFFEYAAEHGLFAGGAQPPEGAFAGAYRCPTARGHHLSRAEIAAAHRRALRRYFLRPRFLARQARGIASWRGLIARSRAAASLLALR